MNMGSVQDATKWRGDISDLTLNHPCTLVESCIVENQISPIVVQGRNGDSDTKSSSSNQPRLKGGALTMI